MQQVGGAKNIEGAWDTDFPTRSGLDTPLEVEHRIHRGRSRDSNGDLIRDIGFVELRNRQSFNPPDSDKGKPDQ